VGNFQMPQVGIIGVPLTPATPNEEQVAATWLARFVLASRCAIWFSVACAVIWVLLGGFQQEAHMAIGLAFGIAGQVLMSRYFVDRAVGSEAHPIWTDTVLPSDPFAKRMWSDTAAIVIAALFLGFPLAVLARLVWLTS
jgi:hypothetical protein